jgi:hypothetical protein
LLGSLEERREREREREASPNYLDPFSLCVCLLFFFYFDPLDPYRNAR